MHLVARPRRLHSLFFFNTTEEGGVRAVSFGITEWVCRARPNLHSRHSSRESVTRWLDAFNSGDRAKSKRTSRNSTRSSPSSA